MIKRIFIAIPLTDEIKEELAQIQAQHELPVSWAPKDNLHITLLFLGAVQAKYVSRIARSIERIAQKHQPFVLDFGRISYGPNGTLPPRLVWLAGESNSSFEELKEEIDRQLKKEELYYPSRHQPAETKIHVTLGRVRKWEWAKVNPEEREGVDQKLSFQVSVDELLVMESKLTPGRPPIYSIVEKIPLGSA